MAFNIVSRTIAGSADSMIEFSGGTIGRYFGPFGTSWSKLRMFWQWQMPFSSNYYVPGNKLYAGLIQTGNDAGTLNSNSPLNISTGSTFFGLVIDSLSAIGNNTYPNSTLYRTFSASTYIGEIYQGGFYSYDGGGYVVAASARPMQNLSPLVLPMSGGLASCCMEISKLGLDPNFYPIFGTQIIYSNNYSISSMVFPISAIDSIMVATNMSDVSAIINSYGNFYASTSVIAVSACANSYNSVESICFAWTPAIGNFDVSNVYINKIS